MTIKIVTVDVFIRVASRPETMSEWWEREGQHSVGGKPRPVQEDC